jgi:hypothetical protein
MDLTFYRRPIPAAGLTNFYPARTFCSGTERTEELHSVRLCGLSDTELKE